MFFEFVRFLSKECVVLHIHICMYRCMYGFDFVLLSSFVEEVFLVSISIGPGYFLIRVGILSGLLVLRFTVECSCSVFVCI